MRKNWLRVGIIFILMLVFLYFFFRSVEWKEVFQYLSEVNVLLFVLVVVTVPIHMVTRAIRWKYLLMHEKKNVKFFNRFAANAVGFMVT